MKNKIKLNMEQKIRTTGNLFATLEKIVKGQTCINI